jgi:hypothetical protein
MLCLGARDCGRLRLQRARLPRPPAHCPVRCRCGCTSRENSGARSLHFPSTFPPRNAKTRGTGRNRWGRQGTVGAVSRLFALVRPMGRVQWGCDGTRGEPRLRPVKSPASAYPGSNPAPAAPVTSADMVPAPAWSCNPAGPVSLRFRSRPTPCGRRPRVPGRPAEPALGQSAHRVRSPEASDMDVLAV